MKQSCSILLVIILLAVSVSAMEPQAGSTAVGAAFFAPTGMNFKSWFTDNTGLSITFGINPFRTWRLFMNADVLYHFDVIYNAPFYAGGGLLMEVDSTSPKSDNFDIGLHAVLGEEWFLKKAPVSFFAEGGGTMYWFPFFRAPAFGWTACAGVRYYITER
jgi:hypothetical protein